MLKWLGLLLGAAVAAGYFVFFSDKTDEQIDVAINEAEHIAQDTISDMTDTLEQGVAQGQQVLDDLVEQDDVKNQVTAIADAIKDKM